MKAPPFWIYLLISLYAIACGGSSNGGNASIDSSLIIKTPLNQTIQKARIINPVLCQSDPAKSYALYIPADSSKLPMAVVYFFDPHGDGLLPVKLYKSLADSFHFILVGSNNSKNGNDWNDAQSIWNALNEDVPKRQAIDPGRIYLCGFSGGAKVATYIALHNPGISAVIANGAGLEDITAASNINFSFTAITGNGDMNMTDLVSIDNALDKTPSRHRIIFYNGPHQWAPQSAMNTAFEGLQLDAMQKNRIQKNLSFINSFALRNQQIIEGDEANNELLNAEEICRMAASMLDGVTLKSAWFHQKEDSIIHTGTYQKQELVRQQLLQKEENIKAGFQQEFQTGDQNYWNKTIADVKSRAGAKTPEGAMYQRLQAFLSLAFYSISNQLIDQNQNKEAQYFVTLYKKVDPANSEAWYFSAILCARNNDPKGAKDDLAKSVSLGFNDKNRLEQQPEFSNSKTKIDLPEIEAEMK